MFVAAMHPSVSRMVRIIKIINPFVFFPPDYIYFLASSTFIVLFVTLYVTLI